MYEEKKISYCYFQADNPSSQSDQVVQRGHRRTEEAEILASAPMQIDIAADAN